MPTRNFLYVLRPATEPGRLLEAGRWASLFPSLWQILLAEAEPAISIDVRCVLGDAAAYCIVADAARGLQRYESVVRFLRRHPRIHCIDGLTRYLDGALHYLEQAVESWSVIGEPAPLFGANLDEVARRRGISFDQGVHDQLIECVQLWQALEQAMHADEFEAIEKILRFPEWNLRFDEWKAWAGVFGLALFEHKYFTHAFRQPLEGEYLDFEYDELGSDDDLGAGRYRYRENGKWGVRTQASVVLAAEWDRVLRAGEDEAAVVWIKRGDLFGLAGIADQSQSRVLLAPSLDEVSDFIEGIAVVRCGMKMGFLARDGRWCAEPVWDEACEYANGYAVVLVENRFGYLDADGRNVIAAQFDEADDFTAAGVARVRRGELCGLIRGDGSFALPLNCTRLDWSEQLSGWRCVREGAQFLAHPDGSTWVDIGWDSIEACVPGHSLRVQRDRCVGLLRWSGESLFACEYDDVQPRYPAEAVVSGRIEFIVRRGYRRGLIDEAQQVLVPLQYSAIENLEPHFAAERALITRELLRVRSMPGEGRPRVGIWDIGQQRCIVPCRYDFIWTTLLGEGDAYGFIVANRNAKRGESSKGRYAVGMLHADGSVLIPQQYAWIAEQTELDNPRAISDLRDTIFFCWGRGEPIRAAVNKNGPQVLLHVAPDA